MAYELKITADTAVELGEKITELMTQFGALIPPAGNEKPKPARRKASTDSAPADGAASEPSSPNASVLEPADETAKGLETFAEQDKELQQTLTPAGPTRDDALTAATKFSQEHGVEKLEAALEAVGAKKFSDIPVDKYGAFIAEMEKAGKSASALS